jgi:hypothetical protein
LLNVPEPLPKQLWETKEVGDQLSVMLIIVTGSDLRGLSEILQESWEEGREGPEIGKRTRE